MTGYAGRVGSQVEAGSGALWRRPKKMGREIALGPNRYEGQKTSRGEQLMRRHWEE